MRIKLYLSGVGLLSLTDLETPWDDPCDFNPDLWPDVNPLCKWPWPGNLCCCGVDNSCSWDALVMDFSVNETDFGVVGWVDLVCLGVKTVSSSGSANDTDLDMRGIYLQQSLKVINYSHNKHTFIGMQSAENYSWHIHTWHCEYQI